MSFPNYYLLLCAMRKPEWNGGGFPRGVNGGLLLLLIVEMMK